MRRALRRIFGEGDGFQNWAFPIYRAFGILVRVHLLLVVYAAVRLLKPIAPGTIGLAYEAFFLGAGFLFVLLHEYGHCIACRKVGGEADEILLWPLGGLAMCRPPHDWKSALITTLGGPAVNVILAVVLGGVLLGLGAGWGVVLFNPFNIGGAFSGEWFMVNSSHVKTLLFFSYAINVYLTLFNMLLPMFPMDCGRVVQELLWWKMGYHKSMVISTTIGLVAAVCVGTYAIFAETPMLLGIAVFSGFTCYSQKQQLKLMVDQSEPWAASLRDDDRDDRKKYAAAARQQQRERDKQAEVDRILAKIAATGMDSLSRREKAALKEATERKRAGA